MFPDNKHHSKHNKYLLPMSKKLVNISIGARLYAGFGIIMLLIVLIGFLALSQSNRLWKFTSDLYEHPLQVSKATRDIKNDVNSIHNLIKDIAIDDRLDPKSLYPIIIQINEKEADALNSFDLVYERYLGQKSHIDSAYVTFKKWKILRDQIIEDRLNGDNEQAYVQYRIKNLEFRDKLFSQVQVMLDFANVKADTFYHSAIVGKQKIVFWIRVILAGLFILTLIISYLILNSIRKPVKALASVADQFRQGNFDARSEYISTNEIGRLSASFNKLATSVQQQIILNNTTNELAQLLTRENELHPFCIVMLSALINTTRAEVAAIYMLNEQQKEFEPFESLGLETENFNSFAVKNLANKKCKALVNSKSINISKIPSDTLNCFKTLVSDYIPQEIITIPILEDNELISVILLCSKDGFTETSATVIEKIHFILTARIHGVLAFEKISKISQTLNQQFRALEEKSKELAIQSDELKEYNLELKMQKDEVDEANKYKSAFLSNMSHELRTPLNSIIALSGVLTRKLKNDLQEDEYKYLSIIEKNGKQLLAIINDILDLSRVESGKEEIKLSRFSVSSLVDSILESLEPLATEKGLKLVNTISKDLPALESDSTKCRHILQNIISNALKFTDEGSVKISAKSTTDEIIITIMDTGIGIEPDTVPKIFDEFKQADDKMSRKYGGTGLGLAIAKKYVILLGGSIEVHSRPGSGSTFIISLPLVHAGYGETERLENTEKNTAVTHTSETDSPKAGKATILLVEDSEPQVIQMKYMLTKEGYIVKTASNGKEALESIKNSVPDAMILDLMMPEVDGFQVIDSIRSHPETSQLPVLILTAKHITKNELFFLKGNHIHQIIFKGVVNRSELLEHVSNMVNKIKTVEPEKEKYNPFKNRPRIFVIEDTQDNLDTVKALLSGKCEISGTTEYSEALNQALEQKPDLILMNVSMPEDDDFILLHDFRSNIELKYIPVIALTARAMKGDKEELLANGFDGYISKPIEIEMMEETIATILQTQNDDIPLNDV